MPGHLDLRALLGRDQWTCTAPVVRRVPYRTQAGLLSFRSWVRTTPAEATIIDYVEGGLRLVTQFVGLPREGHSPRLLLRRRDPVPSDLVIAEATVSATELVFTVPIEELVRQRLARHDDWDTYLDLGDSEPVRIARLMDDVAEKNRTYVYPPTWLNDSTDPLLVEETPEPTLSVTPYFNVDGNLALAVTDRG